MSIDKEKWKSRLLKGGYYGARGVLWVFYRITDVVGMGAIYLIVLLWHLLILIQVLGFFFMLLGGEFHWEYLLKALLMLGGDVLAVIFGVIIFQIMYREYNCLQGRL